MKVLKSFSTRLSLNIVLMTTAIFVVSFSIFFSYARSIEKEMAIENAENILSATNGEIYNELQNVETAVNNMLWLIERYLQKPDSLFFVVEKMVKSNHIISGSAIAFTANHYKEKGLYYAPYAYTNGEEIITKQLGSQDYNYFEMEWFYRPLNSGAPHWSEPYFDKDGANITMSTYSIPIKDSSGQTYAIITADISLEWLREVISDIKPYKSSLNAVLSNKGAYIVHEFDKQPSIPTDTLSHAGAVLNLFNKDKVTKREGYDIIEINDEKSYVFYAPVHGIGWSIAMICPVDEVFEKLEGMKNMVIIVISLGIILLLLFCYNIIFNMSIPLRKLASSANSIATGDFNVELPTTKHKDEIGELRDSFDYMQRSLTEYIEQLKSATSSKERIESELRIAHDIQMGMIPKIFPPFPDRDDIDLYAALEPAKEVGGDLYDFFIIDNKLYIVVGDVSGKGVPASLFMAVSKSLFRSTANHISSPAMILKSMNEAISESNEANMFITMFAASIDLTTNEMIYCNAGHTPPLIADNNSVRTMKMIPNIPIGLFNGFTYKDEQLQLNSGELLVIYTDGISEAENSQKELFGEKRLISCLEHSASLSAKEVVNLVISSVAKHAGDEPQSDDITILTIKITEHE